MGLVDFHLRIDATHAESDEVTTALKALAEKYPGAPRGMPVLHKTVLGRPVGDCCICGGLVCEDDEKKLRCDKCGPTQEPDVFIRVPRS